jgi:hypothetical protein
MNNAIEQDINRIRLEIYEETKEMAPEQRVEHTRRATEETIKKYGFKVIANAKTSVNNILVTPALAYKSII